jgi:dGTPase
MNWDNLLSVERRRKSKRDHANDPRNEFESDFGRVIFSPAVRRMHDKTQVMPLTTDDNIHTRLTHSMEVMTIGYSLGLQLIENNDFIEIIESVYKDRADEFKNVWRVFPTIIKTAGLVHDIGNPPFGHFGEESIQAYFKKYFENSNSDMSEAEKDDFRNFDGNAQGFRILTKLQILNDKNGLNLAYATLGSYLKYPNAGAIDKKKLNTKKRGVFQSEIEALEKVAKGCGLYCNDEICRHPLSFLVEAADSICYRVMDLEDGYNKKWYTYDDLRKYFKGTIVSKYFDQIDDDLPETNKIVELRIKLLKDLTILAMNNFIKNIDSILAGKYHCELIEDDNSQLDKSLERLCNDKIFPQREIVSLELTGDSIIKGLLDFYIKNLIETKNKKYTNRVLKLISKSIKKATFLENDLEDNDTSFYDLNDYYKLRIIVDYISGMTDQYALSHYQRLNGQKII